MTEAGVYTITLDWDIGTDIDLTVCPEGDPLFGDTCGNSFSDHPEEVEMSLTPGTYIVLSEDFGALIPTPAPGHGDPDAAGTTLTINVFHAPPEAAALKAPAAKATPAWKVRSR